MGKEFGNSHTQKWLHDNGLLMYSTYNEGKSIDAEWFMKISYLNKLVDQCNNTYW